jgi:multidrug efflux system membrane fusion protein
MKEGQFEKRSDLPDQTPGTSIANPPETPKVEHTDKGPRRWPWVLAVLILLSIGAGVFFQRRSSKAEPARGRSAGGPPMLMIGTTTASKGDIGVYVSALGLVTPVNTVSIRSRVDGQLVKVLYREGQAVHQGDPLAEIDPGPFEAALAQAEGQLARDTALLENARLDLDRYKEAFAKNAIPKQQLDTQAATLRQYEGAVRLDQGQVDNAKIQLAYCHIAAPISGRVGLRLVDAGNIVHASDTNPLIVITQLEPITVIFSVAEDYLPQIQQQLRQGKRLIVDAFDRAQQKKIGAGFLQTLDNQIDTTTGTVKLKALFPNEEDSLFPNQFVNARLLVDTHRGVTLLPNPVVQHNAQGAFVYLLKPDQTVAVHPITVGTTDGEVSEVEGLDPGATVAADNFNRLNDGAKVVVRPAGGPARVRPQSAVTNRQPANP